MRDSLTMEDSYAQFIENFTIVGIEEESFSTLDLAPEAIDVEGFYMVFMTPCCTMKILLATGHGTPKCHCGRKYRASLVIEGTEI